MENSADGSGGFQDLLSAALSESGLTDDLFDLSDPSESTGQPAVVGQNASSDPGIHDNSNLATLAEAATSVKTFEAGLGDGASGQTAGLPNGLGGGTGTPQVVKQVATIQVPSTHNGVATPTLQQTVSMLQQRTVVGQPRPAGATTAQRISSPQVVSTAQPRIPMRVVTRQVVPGTVAGQQTATQGQQIRMISGGQQVRFVTQAPVRPAAQQQQTGQPVRVMTQSPSGASQIRMVRPSNGQTVRIIRHPGGGQQMHIVTQPKTPQTAATAGTAQRIRLVNANSQQVRMVSGASPQVRMVTTATGQQIRLVTHPPGTSPASIVAGANTSQVRMVTPGGQVRTLTGSPAVRMVSQTSAGTGTTPAQVVQAVASATSGTTTPQMVKTLVTAATTSPQIVQAASSPAPTTMKVVQTSAAPATTQVLRTLSSPAGVQQVIKTPQQQAVGTPVTVTLQNNLKNSNLLNVAAGATVAVTTLASTVSSTVRASSPLVVAATTASTTLRPVILGQTAAGQTIIGQSAGGQTVIGKNAAGQTVIRRVVINQPGTQQLSQGGASQSSAPIVAQVSTNQIGGAPRLTQLVQSTSAAAPKLTQAVSASQILTQPAVSVLQAVSTAGRASPIQLVNSPQVTSVGTPHYVTTTDAAGNKTVRIVSMTPKTPSAYTIQRVASSPALLQGNPHVLQNPVAPTTSLLTNTGSQQLTIHTTPSGKVVVNPRSTGGMIGQSIRTVLGNKMALGGSGNTTPRSGSPSAKMLASLVAPSTELKKQLTSKDVSRLWVNEDIKLKKLANPNLSNGPASPLMAMGSAAEDMEGVGVEEEEELGHAETYADYWPKKVKIGEKHPDHVVETSSLSSVEPPDVWYKLSLPETTIDYGHLSAVQLESITYTCQKHSQFLPSGERAGYIIGDGAGVGKGRTIAGIIFENYLQGRKRSLWLSVSNDLRVDAERDLRDIGAGKIEVHPLNKFKYAKISSHVNGSVKKGVIFSTYSALIGESHSGGKYRTRFKQLLQWMSKEFDGCIIFDECHRAKNLCPVGSSKPTKTGLTVLEIQKKLPKARIVYASATGASEPRNMAYMTRLGLWGKGTPFKEFNDFIQAIEKRGVGAMELVAMDMKLRGMYIARQLSFKGVTFKIQEVPVPHDFEYIYNASVDMWIEAREKFQRAADLIDAEHRMKKSMWGQFWSAHQRFFKYLCISAKVPYCVKLAREAVKNGKCIVIGLQSTGEARTLEAVEEAGGELNDFVSTAKGVFQTLVEKHFPAPDRAKTSGMFGLGRAFTDSPVPSPKAGNKRKKDGMKGSKLKRAKTDLSSDDNSDTSSSDDEDGDDDDDGKGSNSSGEDAKPSSESELSLSESDSGSEQDDDFNPFGNGSDSDDDPWLKKSAKKSAKKNKPAKVKKEVEKKEAKKPKEKKKKKKKKKKRKNKSGFHNADDDSDLDEDIDSQFDAALEAAGLKTNNNFTSQSDRSSVVPGMDAVEQAIKMKRELLDRIETVGDKLPPNTLDELIDTLGGPESVAEMTGRKGRVVSTDDGSVQYESRSETDAPLEILNLTEKQRFMDGEKNIAIISEAASSGISLQADRRAVNQRRRVHITLELPWSADRAIQQFGRTHRSNQVSAPEYVFMISELAGERRFAATVAKRLESLSICPYNPLISLMISGCLRKDILYPENKKLWFSYVKHPYPDSEQGALTHGDRRATESRDLSQFNIDNKYGRAALEAVMKSILGSDNPLVPPPTDYPSNFFDDCKQALVGVGLLYMDERFNNSATLEKDYNNISKFLNRILGMKIELQNCLFKYFTDTLTSIILQAKRFGRWDMGILDLGSSGEHVRKVNLRNFKTNFGGSSLRTQLHTVAVERGMTWQSSILMWRENAGPEDGFYVASQVKNGKQTAILAIMISGRRKEKLFNIFRPNTGLQLRSETLSEIKAKYKKVLPDDAEPLWQDQYQASATTCSHAYWRGNCKRTSVGLSCEVGLRCRTYYILSGSVLGCWNKVESVLASLPGGHATRMQIMRLKTDDGSRIVGSLIPEQALVPLTTLLSQDENPGSAPPLAITSPSITAPFAATIGSSSAFTPRTGGSLGFTPASTLGSSLLTPRTNSSTLGSSLLTPRTNSFAPMYPSSRTDSYRNKTAETPVQRTNSIGTSAQPVLARTDSYSLTPKTSRVSSAFGDLPELMPLGRPNHSSLNSATSAHSPGVTSQSLPPKRSFAEAFSSLSSPSLPASQPASLVDTSTNATSAPSSTTSNKSSPPPTPSSDSPAPPKPKSTPPPSTYLSMPTFV